MLATTPSLTPPPTSPVFALLERASVPLSRETRAADNATTPAALKKDDAASDEDSAEVSETTALRAAARDAVGVGCNLKWGEVHLGALYYGACAWDGKWTHLEVDHRGGDGLAGLT